MNFLFELYMRIRHRYGIFKLMTDTRRYGIGDEAFDPFTGKPMSWIDYEALRHEYRMQALEGASGGKLKRIKKHE